jgi:hypothetical protein
VYLEALENPKEQSEEPDKAWNTCMVSVENSVSTWLREAGEMLGCTPGNKQ